MGKMCVWGISLSRGLEGLLSLSLVEGSLKVKWSWLQLSWDADLLIILNLHSPPSVSVRKLYPQILSFRLRPLSLIARHVQNLSTKQFMMERAPCCLLEPLQFLSEASSKTLRFLVQEDPSILHGVAGGDPRTG